LFERLYARCLAHAPRHGFRFKNKLYSLDTSLIDLSLEVFPWAHYALGKAAMKLHLGLDHDGMLPAFALITESRVSDMAGARRLRFAKGSIVVFDKGYSDYAWLHQLDRAGVLFVTRARDGINARTLVERVVPARKGLRFDRRIALAGKRPREMGMKPLRIVGYTCPETARKYEFLTNIEHLSARTIANLYKARWQIELFFKWLKQNLKLCGFIGTSKNAVLTQIWTALCLSLLLAYLKFVARLDLSLQQIARLLRLNLFLRRDLLPLLRNQTPPPQAPPAQWALAL
jgi:putative transposase